ncbi:hypothetical protein EGW08_009998 [Elysia chlorotica]|uniref:Neurotransmitter-gated ion-channel ligand-binding domain-containing protein n=1 Tax=Elysia chlorotica TaxID=188477 RepID=A0A3S1B8A2_ELYCH|nr:hypothetical protein EGW08_009998 [Elysia chlorotica]
MGMVAKNRFYAAFVLVAILSVQETSASSRFGPVISRLRKKSDPDVMPFAKEGGPLEVSLTLNIINIASVNPKRGEVEVLVWQAMSWRNPDLAWWPPDHMNVTSVRIHPKYLWTPDITIFNNARATEEVTPPIASVDSYGTVTLLPSLRIRVLCDLSDMTLNRLLDEQMAVCEIRMGSWTYGADILTLVEPQSENLGTSSYSQGSEFNLLDVRAKKNVFYYPCCDEPYEDLKFFFTFSRKRQVNTWSADGGLLHEKIRYG